MTEPGATTPSVRAAGGRSEIRRQRPRDRVALDLAGDLPRAARAGQAAPLHDRLRQQPPRRRAAGGAPQRAGRRGRGSPPDRARPPRLARPRGAARGRGPAQVGRAALPGRHQLARARHRHGRGRPGASRSSRRSRSRPGSSASAAPATASARSRGAASSPSSAPTCSSARWSRRRMRDGDIEPTVVPRNPLDVLAQQIVAVTATGDEWKVPELHDAGPARLPVRRAVARAARLGARHARRALPVGGVRRAAPAHRLGPRRGHDPRAQGRAPARGHQRRHDPRPRPLRRAPARRPARRRARRGDGLRGARRARPSCSAPRPGASRRSRATA